MAVARGLALFIGGFSLLNLLGELHCAGFDANLWWIDLRPMGPALSRALLAAASVLLLAYGIRPGGRTWRRILTSAMTVALLGATVANVLAFHALAARQRIGAGCPVAFSLFVSVGLATILSAIPRHIPRLPRTDARLSRALGGGWTGRIATGATVAACLVGFPLAQMFCFGLTDYRRPADAAVVFGARVCASGRVSQAVADRVRTDCELYREGLVRKIVLSGGPGDGATHETEGMRRFAIRLGVPATDILVDENGLNTQATVRNTCALLGKHGLRRIAAVSHFYHLPRIKLTYARHGREVYTVPARETRRLTALPIYMAREVAAIWVYYLRPLWLAHPPRTDQA